MGSTSSTGHRALRLVSSVAALGLACLACSARAPIEPADSTALPSPSDTARALRVATSGDYAPFSQWPASASEPEGFSVAVARAFARATGRRIEWIRFDWPSLAADLAAERFDLALSGITIRTDRSALGRFSLPLVTTGAVALVAAGSELERTADLDRPTIRIAVNRGGHLERITRATFARARVETVEENERVPERLASGRADAVVTDDLEAPHWQARLPPTRVIGPFTRDRKAAWLPAGRESLARELDGWLLEVERSGELGALRRRHGLPDTETALPLPALLAKLDERLALMPDVARAKHALGRTVEDRAQEERVQEAASQAVEAAAQAFRVTPPDAIALRRFVDVQLRAARFVQARAIAKARIVDASPRLREQARVELETRLRPAIAYLTERSVWLAVAAVAGAPSDGETRPGVRQADVKAALARHALPEGLLADIRRALEDLLRPPRASRDGRAHRAGAVPRATAPSA